MLLIFKSSSRSDYLQENLRVLASPAGAIVETTYSTRWLTPELVEQPRPSWMKKGS